MLQDHKNFSSYKPAEAAALLGISAIKLKRWLTGYSRESKGKKHHFRGFWEPEYLYEDEFYLSFHDLIEARFIAAFVGAGLRPNSVRSLLSTAKILIGEERPLSTQKFKTDGRTIFLDFIEENKEVAVDLRDGQSVFRSFVSPTFKDLDFSNGRVQKWHVAGRDKKISIDPLIAFGQPVIDGTGISAARILEVYQAENDEKRVAKLFEIDLKSVRNAIDFQLRIVSR